MLAAVDNQNVDTEVGLSYAIFNARRRPIGGYQIISWEAPLLRRVTKLSGVFNAKCDLIAYHAKKGQLVAVEVKLRPEHDATNIQHGILQAMAYGYMLQRCLDINQCLLQQQVQRCLKELCHQEVQTPKVESVAYALAAPKGYFRESLNMHGKAGGWIRKAAGIKTVSFAGFWVLGNDKVVPRRSARAGTCCPTIECDIKRIATIGELGKWCNTPQL